ncbi:MAG: SET domain-containing protein-lysine N-methyltransferase, partial [Pseudomonadota bacterium]
RNYTPLTLCNKNQPNKLLLRATVKPNIKNPSEGCSPTSYSINSRKDIAKLNKRLQITYTPDEKEKNVKPLPLCIQEVAALEGQLGVFATQPIKRNLKTPFGIYQGEIVTPAENSETSAYLFEINPTILIDAERIRNWTGFINHGCQPNLIVKTFNKNKIQFYVAKDIEENEQLFFDYGDSFFNIIDKPIYLSTHDGSISDEQQFSQRNESYINSALYQFNESFNLAENFNRNPLILPKIFKYIANNDQDNLYSSLLAGHTNYYAYSCSTDGKQILPPQYQEHITPLMFACMLGRLECIKLLLQFDADVDHHMLHAGFTPLTLLLNFLHQQPDIQPAKRASLEEIGSVILNKMAHPFSVNQHNLGIVDYSIKANSTIILKNFLQLASKEKYLLWFSLNSQYSLLQNIDFNECLVCGKTEILIIIIEFIITNQYFEEASVNTYLNHAKRFNEQALQKVRLEVLMNFYNKLTQISNCDKQYLKQPLKIFMAKFATLIQQIQKSTNIINGTNGKIQLDFFVLKPKKNIYIKSQPPISKRRKKSVNEIRLRS